MRIFHSFVGFSIANAHLWHNQLGGQLSHRDFTGLLADVLLAKSRNENPAPAAAAAADDGEFAHYMLRAEDVPSNLRRGLVAGAKPLPRVCRSCKTLVSTYCNCGSAICTHGTCFVRHLRDKNVF